MFIEKRDRSREFAPELADGAGDVAEGKGRSALQGLLTVDAPPALYR